MARSPKLYKKLVRRRGSLGSHVSLWLAADHVLLVEANLMTERYQRFWLKDIQGFMTGPSSESRWVTGISLLLILFFAMLALTLGSDAGVVFTVLACVVAPFLLYGLLLGRTCRFYVITAVQRTQWTNVARRGQVRKLLARLEPLIAEAQSDVFAAASPSEVVVDPVGGPPPIPVAGSEPR